VRQVVLDLAAHAVHLFDQRSREIVVAARCGTFGLLREDRERGLQPVGEVAGLGDGAAHRLVAVREQRVEIVDQRLQFARIVAGEVARRAALNVREPPPHHIERRETRADECEAGDHRHDGDDHQRVRVGVDDVEAAKGACVERQDDPPDGEEAHRPQDGAHADVAAQRSHAWPASIR
jgi:hypothetical protein